ncbi:elongation factor P hydroxylase [Halomonas llamarensis]|uniref:Elongation factor P hydroxylase n=1 Tax=Halomonas llamarensis TaxID=2945104 RepID=A0ABT0SSJ6_9GAMM|nr:elongation factor P hydroxylase [Halomonas llamarensis]MCL7930553.1 elongation factor P hydroxylase [Halomonas llamarensis]
MEDKSRWTLADITALFEGLFAQRYQTRLIRGGDEPLYTPADASTPYHQVIFARGFYASALHEISHWCIAGAKRRQWEDYGYWYLPDGRNVEQQQAFENAEVAPQALESLFAEASGRTFHVSVDNLDLDHSGGEAGVSRDAFANRVAQRAKHYQTEGLPRRAKAFYTALHCYYQEGTTLTQACEAGCHVLDHASSVDSR